MAWDNGLSTPAFVDINGDRIVDYAYAGDLYGNMWKFDLSRRDPRELEGRVRHHDTSRAAVHGGRRVAGKRQPITVRPEVTRGPKGAGMVVLFGTGKYLETVDNLLSLARAAADASTGSSIATRALTVPIAWPTHGSHAADDRHRDRFDPPIRTAPGRSRSAPIKVRIDQRTTRVGAVRLVHGPAVADRGLTRARSRFRTLRSCATVT